MKKLITVLALSGILLTSGCTTKNLQGSFSKASKTLPTTSSSTTTKATREAPTTATITHSPCAETLSADAMAKGIYVKTVTCDPTLIYGSEAEVYRFTVTNTTAKDVFLNKIAFAYSFKGLLNSTASNSWKIYRADSTTSTVDVSTLLSVTTSTATKIFASLYEDAADAKSITATRLTIKAGSTDTLVLVGPVVDDGVTNTNYFRTYLTADGDNWEWSDGTNTYNMSDVGGLSTEPAVSF